jgi:sRNA-binding carbon storage regulator CsrA
MLIFTRRVGEGIVVAEEILVMLAGVGAGTASLRVYSRWGPEVTTLSVGERLSLIPGIGVTLEKRAGARGVRLGFDAPLDVPIDRLEFWAGIKLGHHMAAHEPPGPAA